MPERKLKVFLSSTAKDLTAFRKAVHARLAASPLFECIRQEEFFAQPHPPVTVCREQVSKADLFVGLIGMRRGWEPPDDNSDHRSITEMEYDWAVAPRFMHVTDTEFPVPGSLRESDQAHQRQLGFRQRVMNELVVSQDGFVSADGLPTPDVLARIVVDQLTNYVLGSDLIDRIRPQRAPDLSDVIAQAVQLLEQRGVLKAAEQGGLERNIVLKLAKRLRPDDALDFDRAVAEVENAITIALDAIARGKRGSNEDDFVNDVLKSVGVLTQAGENERAVKALDDALGELDTREAEQRDIVKRSRLTLLQAGITQDLLRRDAQGVAQRVVRMAAIEHPDDSAKRFDVLSRQCQAFWDEGHDKGFNLSLEVAIEIARAQLDVANTADRRGAALNRLAIALGELGERESGTARLEESVAAFRKATKQYTRKRAPLDWAMTQNNLGNALRILGAREVGSTRLKDAVAAFRAAAKEYTREKAPLDWATIQHNIGLALVSLGVRESGTSRLEEALATYREALKERTCERAPLQWATTQHNVGSVLLRLGERESGTARLEDAVTAFDQALKERTRERPLQWAMSIGNRGVALMQLADRRSNAEMAATALDQIAQALAVARDAGHVPLAQYYEAQVPKVRAICDRLNKV